MICLESTLSVLTVVVERLGTECGSMGHSDPETSREEQRVVEDSERCSPWNQP